MGRRTYRSGRHVLVRVIVSAGSDILREKLMSFFLIKVDKVWHGMKAYRRQMHH